MRSVRQPLLFNRQVKRPSIKDLDGSGLAESLKKLALSQIDSGIQENDFFSITPRGIEEPSINWGSMGLKALKKVYGGAPGSSGVVDNYREEVSISIKL